METQASLPSHQTLGLEEALLVGDVMMGKVMDYGSNQEQVEEVQYNLTPLCTNEAIPTSHNGWEDRQTPPDHQ